VFNEVWRTVDCPAVIDNGADPTLRALQLQPDPRGSVIRVLDVPPGNVHESDANAAAESFAEMGAAHAVTAGKSSHPFMHRTETVDYGILISGEIWLIVDEGEIKLNPGDIVIQRGTSHAWSNRSDRPARLVFVLLSGKFATGIA
jgi:mannose-6-phosphate isomerase-like protein (cupin superfamily)